MCRRVARGAGHRQTTRTSAEADHFDQGARSPTIQAWLLSNSCKTLPKEILLYHTKYDNIIVTCALRLDETEVKEDILGVPAACYT